MRDADQLLDGTASSSKGADIGTVCPLVMLSGTASHSALFPAPFMCAFKTPIRGLAPSTELLLYSEGRLLSGVCFVTGGYGVVNTRSTDRPTFPFMSTDLM